MANRAESLFEQPLLGADVARRKSGQVVKAQNGKNGKSGQVRRWLEKHKMGKMKQDCLGSAIKQPAEVNCFKVGQQTQPKGKETQIFCF